MVPGTNVGCGAEPGQVDTPLRGGSVVPASVGCSEDGRGDRGGNVGASDPKPSGTSVGASDGGGKSDEELPGALDGERTAAPPSACFDESLSCRNRPCSPMGSYVDEEDGSLAEGETWAGRPPFSRPREKLKVYTRIHLCQRNVPFRLPVKSTPKSARRAQIPSPARPFAGHRILTTYPQPRTT